MSPAATPAVREATAADDPAIRALLHARPMDGAIRVALTRDPDWRRAAAVEGERGLTLVFHHPADGRFLGFAARSVRRRYIDGKPTWVGYLGQLRAVAGSVGLGRLRRGYERFREARRPDEAPFDLTAILTDNHPARRLLERGLPGLPPYRPLAELETLILSTTRRHLRSRRRRGDKGRSPGAAVPLSMLETGPATVPDFLAFLEGQLRHRPFAPVWTAEDFTPRGRARDLTPDDVFVLRQEGRVVATGALWDQRAFKQTVIQGYAPWLGALRPLVNFGLRLGQGLGLGAVGQPPLPPPGTVLPLAYLACFAVAGEGTQEGVARACAMVEGVRREAHRRGLGQLAFTLPREHPLTAPLRRRFAARPYHSLLYAVVWEGADPAPPARPYVEAALL
jgi:hypothetical protein